MRLTFLPISAFALMTACATPPEGEGFDEASAAWEEGADAETKATLTPIADGAYAHGDDQLFVETVGARWRRFWLTRVGIGGSCMGPMTAETAGAGRVHFLAARGCSFTLQPESDESVIVSDIRFPDGRTAPGGRYVRRASDAFVGTWRSTVFQDTELFRGGEPMELEIAGASPRLRLTLRIAGETMFFDRPVTEEHVRIGSTAEKVTPTCDLHVELERRDGEWKLRVSARASGAPCELADALQYAEWTR